MCVYGYAYKGDWDGVGVYHLYAVGDAQYHRKCLVALYNLMWQFSNHGNINASRDRSLSEQAVALAELASYIEESAYNESMASVFKLSDLVKLYTECLNQLGCSTTGKVNSTRLKERLLLVLPELRCYPHGREVLLAYERDIGTLINFACEENHDSDVMLLAKAAKIVRKQIFDYESKFDGSFNNECQKRAVPDALVTLIRMILEGTNIACTDHPESISGRNTIANVISQLVAFNSVRLNSGSSSAVRHSEERETPLPIYLGLMIHATTRKRDIIDKLHKLGLSISYDRVLKLSTDLANAVCKQYDDDGIVCPPGLRKNVFTSSAVDNIDHNPSSTTTLARDSFHGTAISLTNHLSDDCPGVDRTSIHIATSTRSKTVTNMPSSYTLVSPASLHNKHPAVPLIPNSVMPTVNPILDISHNEQQWLNTVVQHLDNYDFEKNAFISWAAYHAQSQSTSVQPKAKIALLPLFNENANSVAMIKHAMTITKGVTEYLNPGQIPVIAMNQPLFSLAKQIQWTWPSLSEENFVVMLGGLHIEMAILNMLGKWLDGSGWCGALVEAGVVTSGRAAALLFASHVKRSRYAHQVTIASLHALQSNAYATYCKELPASEEPLQFKVWCQTKNEQHPQFYYWTTVMELELLLMQFIRSLREGNFIYT